MVDRILVTPRSLTNEPHPEVERLRDFGFELVYSAPGVLPTEDELVRLVPDCIGWLAGIELVTERVIAAARTLRVISRNGVGIDNLPLEVLAQRGIKVAVAEGANAMGVAELTIGLMLAAARSIPMADRGIKQGAWPRRRGIEIRDRTVGVIGCGAIGREVARMAIALGARVLAFDPIPPDLGLPAAAFRFASLNELLACADVVTLHCPAPAHGRALVDAAALALMRPDAILINTARAALVDEAALKAVLDAKRLFAYGTDVFSQEPPRDVTLAGHERVIATSHIGGFTEESIERATRIAAANLVKHLRQGAECRE